MKAARFQREAFSQGRSVKAIEKANDGFAEMTINMKTEGLLFQYSPNTRFIFSNPKRSDGILFQQEEDDRWSATLIELKRQVKLQAWSEIKQQWHGAWLHAMAIAGAMEIRLSAKVQCVIGYRNERLGLNNPDPVLLKTNADSQRAYREWNARCIELDDVGKVSLTQVQLDENGFGEVAL